MVNWAISDWLAAGSLLIAAAALVKSFLSDKKLKRLDLRLKEKELKHHEASEVDAKKADVEVEVIDRKMLLFYNKGTATAYNVRFAIPSDDTANEISLYMSQDYLPYPKLLSFQKFEVQFYNCSYKPHQTIVITWDDEFAKGRSKEMVVDM